ncbi:hypothetical protein BS47DRAFT_754093 [Hydnum rufescens UP504]|uniref:F-box domain-containing protein n=1 Tax=Hydnum rufescens UP504 TaxID=1448309 RepID=A0A9P6BA01_9AGAM|nr:hypothetical protein BS47DRAFT_754093 [Hydnum rufescens UP504]
MPILRLPNELLSEIASYVPDRHPVWGYTTDSYFLAALSTTSRKLRAVSLPYLYRETLITSQRQLQSLANSPVHLLLLIRELNIFMDGEFVDAWKIGAARRQAHWEEHGSNIFDSFAAVLSRTPALRTLRIRVAELTGQRSGWRKFALVQPFGIPIGPPLLEALHSADSAVTLPQLQTLELDGFEDVDPLLRLTPNLDRLCVSLSAGFWRGMNTEVCAASIWPFTRCPQQSGK